jgi:hypothetical protein
MEVVRGFEVLFGGNLKGDLVSSSFAQAISLGIFQSHTSPE